MVATLGSALSAPVQFRALPALSKHTSRVLSPAIAVKARPSLTTAAASSCRQDGSGAPSTSYSFQRVGCVVPTQQAHEQRLASSSHGAKNSLLAAVTVVAALSHPESAMALGLHEEPANALSLPTWAIHVSSVVEWATAMGLMWKFADVTGNQLWKGMTWGMLPCLGSAMAACTWHFFYNSPDLEFLVVIQSALTVVGNCTCWLAAYRIYKGALEEKKA